MIFLIPSEKLMEMKEENWIDTQDQEEKFLSVSLSLTDLLIETLSDCAMEHGYIRALKTLKAIRRNYHR